MILKFFLKSAIVAAVLAALVVGCSPKQTATPLGETFFEETADSVSYAEVALRESVSESLAVRPSWTYYQYGLQAIDNQEWNLARHYLDEALRQLVAEKFDSAYKNVSPEEDSLYRLRMPAKIVRALDEVFPNFTDVGDSEFSYMKNEVAIEGVDALDESKADSLSLRYIENFLDTVDKKQFTLPIEFNDRVQQEIFYMTTTARAFTEGSLNRKTAYDSLIYAVFEESGVPKDLIYMALVESGFKVKAYSRAKASGMWQFIPETGVRYGMDVDYWVDMRRNPQLATEAAAQYLSKLYDTFGDWLLAMAAYNCGEGRVRRLIREMQEDSSWDSSHAVSYWDLDLPKETMRYVPRILAAMVVGHFPDQYNMRVEQQYLPEYDTVTVFDSFTLEEIAKMLKVPEDSLRDLNMELIMWCTPPDRDSYQIRLPVGKRAAFIDGYDKMEKNNFSSWHHHKVAKGENLSSIAKKYGTTSAEIKQANGMKNSRIKVGKNLLIPIKVKPKKSSGRRPAKVKIYVAKLGDNLASIARHYGVSQESLRAWNSLDATAFVKMGDTLFVSKPEEKTSGSAYPKPTLKKDEKYVVEPGDSYASIAEKFGVSYVALMDLNNGFNYRLCEGDSLKIPEASSSKKKKNAKSDAKASKSEKKSGVEYETYKVQAGDNLYVIAKRYSTSVARLRAINGMGNSNAIHPGNVIKVKEKKKSSEKSSKKDKFTIHKVKKGEGLWDIARQYKVTVEDLVRWNNLKNTKVKPGEKIKVKKKG